MVEVYLLTNSDLDTSLVEFDGGRPGDEPGTEKEYLVDHCCELCEYVLFNGRLKELQVHVDCHAFLVSSMAHKIVPWATDDTPPKEASYAAMSEFASDLSAPGTPQAGYRFEHRRTLEEPAGYNFFTLAQPILPLLLLRGLEIIRSPANTHEGYHIVSFRV